MKPLIRDTRGSGAAGPDRELPPPWPAVPVARFLGYCWSLGARPQKVDFDPAALGSLLADIVLWQRRGARDLAYRIVGETVKSFLGGNPVGRSIYDAAPGAPIHLRCSGLVAAVLADGRSRAWRVCAPGRDGRAWGCYAGAAALWTGERISHVAACAGFFPLSVRSASLELTQVIAHEARDLAPLYAPR